MEKLEVRYYYTGAIAEVDAATAKDMLESILRDAGFKIVGELSNEKHTSMRHLKRGVDITLTRE